MDSLFRQEIPGNLFPYQLIESNVVIKRPNQIVPILMRSLGGIVPLVAIGIGVTNHIHPMAGKAFPKMGACQKPIHQLFISGMLQGQIL